MHDCGPLVGIQTEKLLEVIQTTATVLKDYETLTTLAPTRTEKDILRKMLEENTNLLSDATSWYLKLTGTQPAISSELAPGFINYAAGIQTVKNKTLYLSKAVRQLFQTAAIPDIADLLTNYFVIEHIHASNINLIYAINRSGKQYLFNVQGIF